MSTLHIFEHRVVGPLQCNCYVIGDADTKEAMIIDPGDDAEGIAESCAQKDLTITAIVATHAHFDHIVAAGRLRELTRAAFHLHDEDRPLLDWMQESGRMFLGVDLPSPPEVDTSLDEGDRLKAGEVSVEVIHTPGHSPGSVSLAGGGALFSGDTLFAGSIGRFDLPGGDQGILIGAIKSKLFEYEDDVPVYPGHGPATTIGAERRYNPFVGAAATMWLPPNH